MPYVLFRCCSPRVKAEDNVQELFSPSTMWGLKTELRLLGLNIGAFTAKTSERPQSFL